MKCFKAKKPKSRATAQKVDHAQPQNVVKHEVVLAMSRCNVHLIDDGEAVEQASGDFTLIRISDGNVLLATIVNVGDEPVVKFDHLHYLFTLPVKDGSPLSYGVSFSEQSICGVLDKFLKENACFSTTSTSTSNKDIDWKEFAPKVQDYNNFLTKAIAGGTGQIVKGILKC